MTERVALIGAGIMGQAIGTRLLECGHALTVFDIDPAKVASLWQEARRQPPSPAEATARLELCHSQSQPCRHREQSRVWT